MKHNREDEMSVQIEERFVLMSDRNSRVAYKALQDLQRVSEETGSVYPYMDRLMEMLDSMNSYVRTRGLTLIACNAKWDQDGKINESLDKILGHVTDVKPIAARQCIRLLPVIAEYKPELRNRILSALEQADLSVYGESMQSLVSRDIQKVLNDIRKF